MRGYAIGAVCPTAPVQSSVSLRSAAATRSLSTLLRMGYMRTEHSSWMAMSALPKVLHVTRGLAVLVLGFGLLGCAAENSVVPSPAPSPALVTAGTGAVAQAGTGAVTQAGTGAVAQAGTAAPTPCVVASSCVDIDVPPLTAAACCTPVSSCGYLLPELDPTTLMYFPEAKDFLASVAKDDPNGRCAPESFFFGPQQGLNEERHEETGAPDILIASTCSSFHIVAFTLAGCCLPDNTCGLSTHAYGRMFAETVNDLDAPFATPECVPAEVLNQQFRASALSSLARLTGGGSCNYAEIDARQPHLQ